MSARTISGLARRTLTEAEWREAVESHFMDIRLEVADAAGAAGRATDAAIGTRREMIEGFKGLNRKLERIIRLLEGEKA